MSGISQDLEQFLANCGKTQQLPSSGKGSQVIKFCGFTRSFSINKWEKAMGAKSMKNMARWI